MLSAIYMLNLGYAFAGTGTSLDQYQFVSKRLGGVTDDEQLRGIAGNRFRGHIVGRMPVPLPAQYVLGIDSQAYAFETAGYRRPSYLHGEWRNGGWWYYYLYALCVKVPLGTVLLAVLALLTTLSWRRKTYCSHWRNELCLLLPMLAIMCIVSSQTGFNRHLRYVLPAFPFGFVWISKVARAIDVRDALVALPASAALGSTIVASMAICPHSLSYFNGLAGGPLGGPRHLLSSNIDWGQDLLHLKKWVSEHGTCDTLYLAYCGPVDPALAGIDYTCPLYGVTDLAHGARHARGTGRTLLAISVNVLFGREQWVHDGTGRQRRINGTIFHPLQQYAPIARAGYSIYIYDLAATDLAVHSPQ
jgi:hypothetical protein